MRRTLLPAFLLLSSCSSALEAPTPQQASDALTRELRLTWTATMAPDGMPIRVDANGRLVALVASGAPPTAPRSAKPPTVSGVSVGACEVEGKALACETAFAIDGKHQPSQRVLFWKHGAEWRARFEPAS